MNQGRFSFPAGLAPGFWDSFFETNEASYAKTVRWDKPANTERFRWANVFLMGGGGGGASGAKGPALGARRGGSGGAPGGMSMRRIPIALMPELSS